MLEIEVIFVCLFDIDIHVCLLCHLFVYDPNSNPIICFAAVRDQERNSRPKSVPRRLLVSARQRHNRRIS